MATTTTTWITIVEDFDVYLFDDNLVISKQCYVEKERERESRVLSFCHRLGTDYVFRREIVNIIAAVVVVAALRW